MILITEEVFYDVAGNTMSSSLLRVHANIHAQIRRWVHDVPHEKGGNFYVDSDNSTLRPCTVQDDGKRTRIRFRRGPVDWHMHPAQCLEDCVIGLPSAQDLASVCTGVRYGNLFHLLYSREGTYVLQVTPNLRRYLQEHRPAHSDLLRRFTEAISQPLTAYRERGLSYEACRAAYILRLATLGVSLRLFADDAIPAVRVHQLIPAHMQECQRDPV